MKCVLCCGWKLTYGAEMSVAGNMHFSLRMFLKYYELTVFLTHTHTYTGSQIHTVILVQNLAAL